MVKKGIVFIIFLMFSIGAFARSFDIGSVFHMDVSPEFGLVNGSIGEFVFDKNCKNTDNMLSRLDWDVVAAPYGELNLSIDLFKFLYIGFSGRIGIPVYSGHMQDYDWLNSVSIWQDEDPTELTNYSNHDNKIDKYYNIAGKLGGNIPVSEKFIITPYIGYRYEYLDMTAYDGYIKYKKLNFVKQDLPKGKMISYAQEINEFLVGFQLDFTGIPRVPFFFDFCVVPGLGKLSALDIHYGRPYTENGVIIGEATAFLDIINPIFIIDSKFSCFYEINKYNRIGGSSFIHFMPLTRGINGFGPVKNGNIPKTFHGNKNSSSGASRFLFGFSVGYQFNF